MVKKSILYISILVFIVSGIYLTQNLNNDNVRDIPDKIVNIPKENAETEVSEPQATDAKKDSPKENTESKISEDVFWLDLSSYGTWQSGDYDTEYGSAYDYRRRLRYPEPIEVIYHDYTITVEEDYLLNIYEYDLDMHYLGFISIAENSVYEPRDNTAFIRLSLQRTYSEKSLSPGQWAKLFPLTIAVSHGDIEKMINSRPEVLISTSDIPVDGEVLAQALLKDESEMLAGQLWNNQISSNIYCLTSEDLDNGNTTIFISSSEGDDRNSGLSADYPKKSLEPYSSLQNVNLLLKCGDVFDMTSSFVIGSNSIVAAYGEGNRPVLNYYLPLEVTYTRLDSCENVWMADLSGVTDIYDSADSTKNNCNIGQLLIDGEVNWKRKVWSSKDTYDPVALSVVADGSWAINWITSTLYIYSETDPNESKIYYAPPYHGVIMNGVNHVIFTGIEIVGAGKHGINMTNVSNVEVTCCYIHQIGGSVLRSAGIRYGNAVQLWDSGENVTVAYNYADWIFDTCYTNQGSDETAYNDHVLFSKNIGAHSYWGLEIWGDGYSNESFGTVEYSDNIIYANMDITIPDTPIYTKTSGKLYFADENMTIDDYISYRGGYYYHQMSALNINNSGTGDPTQVYDNIFWNTNRFLALITDPRKETLFSFFKNNLFYCETKAENPGLFRYTNVNGERIYLASLSGYADSTNTESIHYIKDSYDNSRELQMLAKKLYMVSGFAIKGSH